MWPDCWVSAEFLCDPIHRKGSGSIITTIMNKLELFNICNASYSLQTERKLVNAFMTTPQDYFMTAIISKLRIVMIKSYTYRAIKILKIKLQTIPAHFAVFSN